MQNLSQLLLARDLESFEQHRSGAATEMAEVFNANDWELRLEPQPYTEANYGNIWQNEARRRLIRLLEEAGVGPVQYKLWLGEMHYTRAIAAPKRLFTDGYKDNQGWRLLALGLPAVGVIVVGLASHYQNAQNHSHLAATSNVFFEHISSLAEQHGVPMCGRRVGPRDWDGTGLFTAPRMMVGPANVGAANADEPGIWLKDVRTTTVKKVLASFMTLVSLDEEKAINDHLAASLIGMRDVANMLLGSPA